MTFLILKSYISYVWNGTIWNKTSKIPLSLHFNNLTSLSGLWNGHASFYYKYTVLLSTSAVIVACS